MVGQCFETLKREIGGTNLPCKVPFVVESVLVKAELLAAAPLVPAVATAVLEVVVLDALLESPPVPDAPLITRVSAAKLPTTK